MNPFDFLSVVALASLPFTELRLALPLAITVYGLHPYEAYLASIIGNSIPVIAILTVLPYCEGYLRKKFLFFEKFFNWWFSHVNHEYAGKFKAWGKIALLIFVAIPFPLTGAWTGSVAAYLFKIPRTDAFLYIISGVFISGIVILLLTLGTVSLFNL